MARLKLLLVEDSPDDAELLLMQLNKTGYEVAQERVSTLADFQTALQQHQWDLIISDYMLPPHTALDALKLLHQSEQSIPFIIVSGKIGEEVAVEALQAGAHDYLLKDRLTRLGPAIDRALKEAAQKRRRNEAEQALRESEERYRRLVETCPEAMFIAVNDTLSFVNPAAVRLLGAGSPVDLLGRPVWQMIDPGYKELFEEYYSQALRGLDGPPLEHKIRTVNDQVLVVETVARSIQYHGDRAVQMLSRDIGWRKQMEADLNNARKMEAVARLASGVANDFNNLLTVISGYGGLLRSALGPDHPLQKDVQHIISSTERAAALTAQLVALGRKELSAPSAVNLSGVIEQSLPLLKRVIGDQVECVASLQAQLYPVRADRGQIENVVLNLAVHARENMPKGGKFYIETSNVTLNRQHTIGQDIKPGDYVVLKVSDTGQGFTDELKEHVFDPFYNAERTPANGLGLATVYAIIKQHEGHIWCNSELGKGSTFEIFLPRYKEKSTPRPTPKPPRTEKRQAAEVVLVVEDEDILRDFASLVLRKSGFHVLTAKDGYEAMDLLRSIEVNLVFSDVVMPNMGGGELARQALEIHPQLPFLFTSGYPNSILNESGLSADTADFLPKPYTARTLVDKIREVLAKTQMP